MRRAYIWMFGAPRWIVDLRLIHPVSGAHRVGGHRIDRTRSERGALMPGCGARHRLGLTRSHHAACASRARFGGPG